MKAIASLLLLLLVGCAQSPRVTEHTVDAAARQRQALAAFDPFHAAGRVGAWNDEQNVSARFDWQQEGSAVRLELNNAAAGQRWLLIEREGQSSVWRNGELIRQAVDVTGLAATELGVVMPPLKHLGHWLRGMPTETLAEQRDADGRLVSATVALNDGSHWLLEWPRSVRGPRGLELPGLLLARRGPQQLRLVISEWSEGQGAAGWAQPSAAPQGPRRLSIPSRRAGAES